MRQFVKSYHVFVPQMWSKLFVYLAYPVFLVWLSCALSGWGIPAQACLMIAGINVATVEIIWDSMVFGGIASKDTNKLEYLKTSVRGMKVLRYSIIADAVRRVLSTSVILGAVYAIVKPEMDAVKLFGCIFATLGCAELSLLITRSFTMLVVMLVVLSVVATVSTYVMGHIYADGLGWSCLLALVFYVLVAMIGRVIIMKKAKGSYYDERN